MTKNMSNNLPFCYIVLIIFISLLEDPMNAVIVSENYEYDKKGWFS